MEFFDLLSLIWETRNTHGLSAILVYIMPAASVLCLICARYERQVLSTERRRGYQHENEPDTRVAKVVNEPD